MTELKPPDNLAARVGRWSASHWKTAVFGWLAFVIAVLMLGNIVGTRQIDIRETNVGQSQRADRMLRDAGFRPDPQTEIVLVQSTTYTANEPAFRAVVKSVVDAVKPSRAIVNLRSPYQPGAEQISADRHSAIVEWQMKGDKKLATKRVDALSAATASVAKAHPDFYVGEAGSISSGKALNDVFGKLLTQAGERSIPLTLAVLLLVFGAIVAAGVPLLLALSAVAATIGLLALPSQLVPMNPSVSAVVLLVGLAVGVDYSLFYLKREREERAAGKGSRAALEAAAATSGRSVLISGVTVLIAMAGLLLSGDQTNLSLGISTMIVVAAAMLGSLTVLPALLSRLGDRVEKGRIPIIGRLRRERGENRFWSAVLTPPLRRPLVSAIAATAVLLVLAAPALTIHTTQAGFESLPKSVPTVTTIAKLQQAFPGNISPAIVAIKTNTDSPATNSAIAELRRKALASGQMRNPIQVEVERSHNVARVTIPLVGNGTDGKSTAALRTLRERILPDTIGTLADATYAVTGGTANSVDNNALLKRSWPLVFAFVLAFAFLLLLVSFRSLLIPLKAIVLNLLSVGAAYGALVAVFQYGWGESVLGFRSNGGIAFWLPIFMFVILFGLSMDYHVFILSRVREAYDRGLTTEDAVAHGIKTTAGVVTSAALVMVGVFSIFASLPILEMKEAGVGLAAAVLIDATIVRAVLLPATMKLLGDWNWYLPSWLNWLPTLEKVRPADTAVAAAAYQCELEPSGVSSNATVTNALVHAVRSKALPLPAIGRGDAHEVRQARIRSRRHGRERARDTRLIDRKEAEMNHLHQDRQRPAGAPASGRGLLPVLLVAQLMVILDISAVNVALPDLARDLQLGASEIGWTITSYSLLFGSLLLLGGRAADLLGRRRVFFAGLTVFTASSLASALAANAASLFAARAGQGLGAAMLSPAMLSIITTSFRGAERARALGAWGAVGGAGAAVGVLLGGVLTQVADWRAIFFINLPVAVVLGVAGRNVIPVDRQTPRWRGLDLRGALVATTSLAGLVYALTQASAVGWTSVRTLAIGLAALAGLTAFALLERRAAQPLLRMRRLQDRAVGGGFTLMLLASAVMFGALTLSSLYLQNILGTGPLTTGLDFLPFAVSAAAGAHLGAAQLVSRFGIRLPMAGAFATAAAGMLLLAGVDKGGNYVTDVLPGLVVAGLGLGMVLASIGVSVLSGARDNEAGMLSGLNTTGHEIGGTLGIAVLLTIATAGAGSGLGAIGATGIADAFLAAGAVAALASMLALLVLPPARNFLPKLRLSPTTMPTH